MINVLTIIYTAVFGGPHNQILQLSHPLYLKGWNTLPLLPQEASTGIERLTAEDIPVLQGQLHRFRASTNLNDHVAYVANFRSEVNLIRDLIRRYQIGLVQICGLLHFHGPIAARFEQVPVVWQLLSDFSPPFLRRLATPLVRQMADVVMTTGLEVAHLHPGLLQLGDRVVSFYPPVNTAIFNSDPQKRARARSLMGVPETNFLVGTVGNMNRQKGHEFFVQAAAHVLKQVPNVSFRILGGSTPSQAEYYEKNVKAKAQQLGLLSLDHLRFMDPGNKVADYLPGFDIFLLTSRAEGVPTSILEAMCCGVPVVATSVGSVAEVVKPNITGLLVPSEDVEAIATAVVQLLQQPALRANMSQNAQQYESQFNIDACTATHIYAYELAMHHHAQKGACH